MQLSMEIFLQVQTQSLLLFKSMFGFKLAKRYSDSFAVMSLLVGLPCCHILLSCLTLPPSATRVQQAQLFNDPQSNCKIMVATDAVGMGLNL